MKNKKIDILRVALLICASILVFSESMCAMDAAREARLKRVRESIPQTAVQRFPPEVPRRTTSAVSAPAVPPRTVPAGATDKEIIASLRLDLADRDRRISELNQENEISGNTIQDLSRIRAEDEKRIKDLEARLLKAAAEKGADVSGLQKTMQVQEKLISDLEKQVEYQREEMRQQVQAAQEEARGQAQKEKKDLLLQLDSLQKVSRTADAENKRLIQASKDLEKQISQQQIPNAANKELRQRLDDAEKAAQAHGRELIEQKSTHEREIEKIRQQLKAVQDQNTNLVRQLDQLKSTSAPASELGDLKTSYETKIKGVRQELVDAQKAKQDAEREIKDMRKEAQNAGREVKKLQDQNAELARQVKELKSAPAPVAAGGDVALVERIKKLEKEVADRQQINETMAELFAQKDENEQKLIEYIEKLKAEIKKK